ncbi:MAG: AAA family ATPase [Myxococcota bacterium]|nr:AAA family ATPase [Myxococcota bacterium]
MAAADARFAGRVVASVLLATGTATTAELEQANAGLSALGRPHLAQQDVTGETPEVLAPCVPVELRDGVLDLLYVLAGDEPMRKRMADSYAGLWHAEREPDAERRTGGPIVSWLIGTLPRHQADRSPEEGVIMNDDSPYRGGHVQHAVVEQKSPLRERVEQIRKEFLAVIATVERVIVGKRDVIERVLGAMAAGGHVLLVDVPGVGKTQLCKSIAAAIDTRFGRIQFTPDLLPMDITGANVFDVRDQQFHFRQGPIFTHILLADEINRATPKTQSALLEVMEERCATVDGYTHRMEEPFSVLATMNPIDHQGTYPLPAAQIDRFMVMLELGYPEPDDEVKVLDFHLGAVSPLASVRPVISREAFIAWRQTVAQIHVTPELKRVAVEYINGLRRGTDEAHAISPRATIAWVRASQARAMLSGREFVTIEDLLDVAPDVLRHRLWTDATTVRERLRSVVVKAARGGQ